MRGRVPLRIVAAGLLLVSAAVLQNETLYAATGARPIARTLRRTKKHDSLTGLWTGAYAAPYSSRQTPFNATIEDTAGALSGSIDEPNTFGDPSADRLFATLRGNRDGLSVSFIKRYDGTGGAAHTVGYEGAVDADFTRIDGNWTLPDWSGPFFMQRAEAGAEAAAERAASASA